MNLTNREFWTLNHGLVFGFVFLAAFAGGLVGLYRLHPANVTVVDLRKRAGRLKWSTGAMP